MSENTDHAPIGNRRVIRLLGFSSFEASKRFLCALDNEIWLSAIWGVSNPMVSVDRPKEIDTEADMRDHLARPSHITVISAHAYFYDEQNLGFCGEGDEDLEMSSITSIGATSMLLIDACHAPRLGLNLKKKISSSGSECLVVGLDCAPGADAGKPQTTLGKDSVAVIGAIIRELCYADDPALSVREALKALNTVNAQIDARTYIANKRPKLYKY
jgi:hypothetical protein